MMGRIVIPAGYQKGYLVPGEPILSGTDELGANFKMAFGLVEKLAMGSRPAQMSERKFLLHAANAGFRTGCPRGKKRRNTVVL